jgi:hypothetical protein
MLKMRVIPCFDISLLLPPPRAGEGRVGAAEAIPC